MCAAPAGPVINADFHKGQPEKDPAALQTFIC